MQINKVNAIVGLIYFKLILNTSALHDEVCVKPPLNISPNLKAEHNLAQSLC